MELKHIGVIMDGNRRWAKRHAFELTRGHNKGSEVFGHLCQWCLDDHIPFLTVYAFSTENWRRNEREIRYLLGLLEKYFVEEKENCIAKGIRIKIIGNTRLFDDKINGILTDIQTATAHCNKLVVQIALSYGGRDEMIRAIKKIPVEKLNTGLTEENFANYLDTAGTPDVDLVIRTGGAENMRLSNFLLWQTAYAELFFSDLLWPDFSQAELRRAMDYYKNTKRKMGR